MKTRNGIFYDLTLSTYKFKTNNGMTFVFSSDLHLFKFEDKYKQHRKEINEKLYNRYHFNFHSKTTADLILYRKIETRGFLVYNGGGQKLCQENLILSGEIAMLKS